MIRRMRVEYGDEIVNLYPSKPHLPAGRKFGRIKHSYELYGVSRPTYNNASKSTLGLPETYKVVFPLFMDMTEDWQWYWVDVFSLSKYGMLYKNLSATRQEYIRTAFKSCTAGFRAFTNGTGWNNGYANYVNGINLDADPMKQETINTGGNVVELLSEIIRIGGKNVYKIRALDGTLPPPNPILVNSTTTPWLVFKATISKRHSYNADTDTWAREDIVIPFGQMDGADVPIPFMADKSENYIEAKVIEVLPDNAVVPTPYH
jgi:hypothetical protein